MADHDDDGRARRALTRIAETLGLPLGAFSDAAAAGYEVPSVAEEAELLALFRAIPDPCERRRCLDLVRATVSARGRDLARPT